MKKDNSSQSNSKSEDTSLDVNKLERIIADHNKDMRTDMASEITGGTRSKAITDVVTVKAILHWHKAEIAKLFEQIRSEVMLVKCKECEGAHLFEAVPLEALTRLEGDNGK